MFQRSGLCLLIVCFAFAGGLALAEQPPTLDNLDFPNGTQGEGTLFSITGSEFRDVTIRATSPVMLQAMTMPGVISLRLGSSPVALVSLSVSGLLPDTDYYRYLDSLGNGKVVRSDGTGTVTLDLDLTVSRFILIKDSPSTILLAATEWTDGSGILHPAGWSNSEGRDLNFSPANPTGIGTWDPATLTGTLVADVTEILGVLSDGVTLDGNGHSVTRLDNGWRQWTGIGLIDRRYVTVKNTVVTGFDTGIWLESSSLNTIVNWCSGWNLIQGNSVQTHGNSAGISVQSWSHRNHVIGNRVSGWGEVSPSAGYAGIMSICYCYYTEIAGNQVTGFGRGIGLGSDGAVLRENTVTGCKVGLDVDLWSVYGSKQASIYSNNFVDNLIQVQGLAGSTDVFDLGLPVGGNYWSDHAFPDLNGDGFSDVPYPIRDRNGVLVAYDNFPRMAPFGINRPPVLAPVGDQTVMEGQTLSFRLSATDPDPGQTLTFSAAGLPPGATFDPATATFTWTPGYDQAGTYPGIEFTVTDDGNPIELDVEIISITVGNTNRPPVFSPVGPQSVNEYHTLTFTVQASDPDGDTVSIQGGVLPPGAAFDPATGVFTWRPDGTQAGVYPLSFFAVDNGMPGLASQLDVVVTVGCVTSPVELARELINEILLRPFPSPAVNSYLANLKKVEIFIGEGKVGPAINQVEAFILKTGQDMLAGTISPADGAYLLTMANDLLALLRG